MSEILFHTPGQQVTIFLEILNGDGYRVDGYVDGYAPMVDSIYLPSFELMDDENFPYEMVKLSTGLYYHQFTLPTGALGVGSFLVETSYTSSDTMSVKNAFYQIVSTAPFGNYGLTLY